MFEYVRKHTKVMMGVLFLLIIPSFVLFGIEGYNSFRDKGATVAQIGRQTITQSEWDAAHKAEVDRLRVAMPGLDTRLFDAPQARRATLERMVQERVLMEASEATRLVTSDARLARELQSNPTIASLRKPDGTLDMERYRQLLGSQGMTPEMFEARVRADLSVRQVETGLLRSATSLSTPSDLAFQAYFERREVQLARFAPADFMSQAKPTDDELKAYYQAQQSQFQSPEQARVEYVVLDMDSVKKSLRLSEQDLKSYYEQNVARLSGSEERRASHILLAIGKDASNAERDKVRARARDLLEQARKAPDSFAELARKHSQDPGSAASGGDLGFFARGAMVKPFEDAVFSMKKSDISDVIESDFGLHIIRLTDIKAPKQKSFDELRANLENDLATQQAQRKFAEAAETFTNTVYEQSDDLKPVADRLKLDIRSADQVQRQPGAGQSGILANPKFLEALFQPDSISSKRNTQAIEISTSQLVAGRVLGHTPARTLPFAEVEKTVRERVTARKAADLARQQGQARLAAWKTQPDSATLPVAQLVARDQPHNLPQPVLDAVLRADLSQTPAWIGVDLGPQGYAVAKVIKATPRTQPVADQQKQERAQYAQWWTQAETEAYARLLRERFKAQIKVSSPAADKATDAGL